MARSLPIIDLHSTTLQLAILRAYKKGYKVTESGVILNAKNKPIKLTKNLCVWAVPDLSKTARVSIPSIFFASYCFYGLKIFDKYNNIVARDGNIKNISKRNIKIEKKISKQNTYFQEWIEQLNNTSNLKKEVNFNLRKRKTNGKSQNKLSKAVVKDIKYMHKLSIKESTGKVPNGFFKALQFRYNISHATISKIVKSVG